MARFEVLCTDVQTYVVPRAQVFRLPKSIFWANPSEGRLCTLNCEKFVVHNQMLQGGNGFLYEASPLSTNEHDCII